MMRGPSQQDTMSERNRELLEGIYARLLDMIVEVRELSKKLDELLKQIK